MAHTFHLKDAAGGKFVWNLTGDNNEIIAQSETYNTKEAAEKGIASVKRNAPTAPIKDSTTRR